MKQTDGSRAVLGAGAWMLIGTIALPVQAQTFVDWQAIDTSSGTATGTLATARVTMTSSCGLGGRFDCGIYFGVSDGSYPALSDPALFSTPVARTDIVGFLGAPRTGAPYSYRVRFSVPVSDPLLLFNSVASTLQLQLPSGVRPERLSGDDPAGTRPFTLTGTTVQGTLVDCAQPCRSDSAGEIRLNGTLSEFGLTAIYDRDNPRDQVDGIDLQISAAIFVPPPDAGVPDVPTPDTGPIDLGPAADGAGGEDAAASADAAPGGDAAPGADAVLRTDAGAAADAHAAGADASESEDAGGCGCAAAGGSRHRAPGAVAMALLLLALRARPTTNRRKRARSLRARSTD
ncbi:MAG: hypothetical protein IT384_18345 [Deltaproteobacteria bacterium]|nr:hypothetical protein [Deltaproteobacteria bacterium]